MKFSELREEDEIRIVGIPTSGTKRETIDITGMVACVSPPCDDETDWYIKVWPNIDIGNGKIWFCESLTDTVDLLI